MGAGNGNWDDVAKRDETVVGCKVMVLPATLKESGDEKYAVVSICKTNSIEAKLKLFGTVTTRFIGML